MREWIQWVNVFETFEKGTDFECLNSVLDRFVEKANEIGKKGTEFLNEGDFEKGENSSDKP